MTLREFADKSAAGLDETVQQQLRRARQNPDPDAIHDLRVAIRRFLQTLRALDGLFPKKKIKKKRRDFRRYMDLTAEIRNRDIALELLSAAGVAEASRLAMKLKRQRESACQELLQAIGKIK